MVDDCLESVVASATRWHVALAVDGHWVMWCNSACG